MLVRLTSSTSGEMVMFAEHAHALWEWMGKERSRRGVFTKDQLPEAIARLREGIEKCKRTAKCRPEEGRAQNNSTSHDDEDEEEEKSGLADETVSLAQRAQPLLNLMEWTQKEGGFITWEASGDF